MIVKKNISLKDFNALRLDGRAANLSLFTNITELKDVRQLLSEFGENARILGGGSTVLISGDIGGLTIINKFRGADIIEETEDKVIIGVNSGEKIDYLIRWCLDRDIYGLENFSGLPGTIAGAVIRNDSSFGISIGSKVKSVKAIDRRSVNDVTITGEECNFDYHSSVFNSSDKGRFFIYRVILQLEKVTGINTNYREIKSIMNRRGINEVTPDLYREIVLEYRKEKFPGYGVPNAGQIFENPLVDKIKGESLRDLYPEITLNRIDDITFRVPVRWLIAKAGWTGKRIGKAEVWKKNPIFLINAGNARPQDFLVLKHIIKNDISEKFGIELRELISVI